MRISVLGSGSRGNSILVEAGETRVLVDAGFSGKDLERRLDTIGVPPADLTAIVITHDHQDHTRGMGVLSRRHGFPIYLTEPTEFACAKLLTGKEPVRHYRPGYPFDIDSIRVHPFITIHDAADPVAVALEDVERGSRVGIATDLGHPTAQVSHALSGCDFLVLEANHDESLLMEGPYPWSVKERISSTHGHLSNHEAAQFATELFHPRLAGVVLAHLSAECNRPELAEAVVGEALRMAGYEGHLTVAGQEEPTPLYDIEELRARMGPEQLDLI
jgi:phosphoribosyl 1,2-cyclic phosphodiesterase